MKKFILIILSVTLIISGNIFAQNNQGKADDGARISITPQVSDQEIPQGAKKLLLNKMKQICAKNGLAGDGNNPFFVMDATIDILSKELTPTAPPMHALNMTINFYIKDANGAVFSETSYEAKGVGTNETKAYIAGIKGVNTKSGQFKAMVERGKTKILEFYNSQCDFIISKANALHKQGKNGEAIKVLESVPPVSKECYDMCMELLSEIEPPAEPEPQVSGLGSSTASSAGSAALDEIKIDDNIYLVYTGSTVMGNKILLNFKVVNKGTNDFELEDYAMDTRLLDGSGNEYKVEKASTAGVSSNSSNATVLPGTPVELEFQFEKVNAVSMFEYKYKGRVYRLKNLDISGTASPAGAASVNKEASVSKLAVNSRVFVLYNSESRFKYKKYSPAKIKTMASAASKNEYEILAMGDCSTDVIWTSDVITKWHKATKNNIKEGMAVLYTQYGGEITDTKCFWIGKVIAVDELYKDKVTIKGNYDEIHKPVYTEVLIIDSPLKK